MSGNVLDKALSKGKVNREECHITNTALCRGESDRDNERAAKCCAPRLLRELRELSPDIPILTLGKCAARAVLGVRSILVARGFVWAAKEIDSVQAALKKAHKAQGQKKEEGVLKAETLAGRAALSGRTVLPTIHPAFVLRADTWNPIFQLDMARACRAANGELGPLEDGGSHEVGDLTVLRGMGDVVSCDIETDGVKPLETKMLCVGLSDGKKTAVIWPWKKKYARPLGKWLGTRRSVVFHNGWNFDVLVMRQHGVVW
jgi:uracil-DNA glycosylase